MLNIRQQLLNRVLEVCKSNDEAYGGMDVRTDVFLTSALVGGELAFLRNIVVGRTYSKIYMAN
jgi:hypothetical protein